MSSGNSGGGYTSGPLGRSGKAEPPNLADYPDEPQYDLATVVQLVGVRPMTLWAWEQQLNIPMPQRVGDGTGGTVRHYSERDLVASIWLRDQILAGLTPAEAAERLLSAQRTNGDAATGSPTGEHPPVEPRRPLNSGPLRQQSQTNWTVSSGRSSGVLTGPPVVGGPTGPIPRGDLPAPQWGGEGNPQPGPGPSTYRGPQSGPVSRGRPSGPLPGQSGFNWQAQSSVSIYPPVGPGGNSGPFRTGGPPVQRGPSTSGARWPAPPGQPRELRNMVPQLLRAFVTFDTYTANRVVDEALSSRSVETVSVGLLQPALARVGELWSRHEMSIPEEHYAVNFVRGRLFSIFSTTVERFDGPLAIVACGPRELHDIGALMLAMFWRRAGLRVVYLGQDVDGPALVQDVRMRRPRLVCVSVMAPQRVRALARIARDIVHLDAPTPTFAYSGAPFARNPELQRRVSGVYLGDDPATATWHAMRLLGVDHSGGAPGPAPQPGTVGQAG
jgi:MerR family transcriptional regulator, light-induced transcriptional regulator